MSAPQRPPLTGGEVLWSPASEYTVRRLTRANAAALDQALLDVNATRSVDWDWNRIAATSKDGWCLVDPNDVPAAAFASRKRRAMNYSLGPAYRLDFFEVRQAPKDPLLTVLLSAVLAKRTIDLGGRSISLGATPSALDFWLRRAHGQRVDEQHGLWKPPLVPIVIPMRYVHDLVGVFDEQRA